MFVIVHGFQVCTVLKSPETVDMVLCLRRAAEIYCEPPEHVSKVPIVADV